mmetsp:Transcript_4323/g.9689  ORF Transcript_4323/g.9689 Transcript_4323/m.9689 type:complete len:532 (+) Transcript_4323:133-1728(+)|eukprot:CAMPEP_0173190932 /NCGR_PEP_ID=MMETSP1141-20130122/12612_1 /TAXON_ID=483371 /ORGANISM="non described non described, Strain CCMP2298" /LENGTH=531 /DNA_ID=CAMNT_0014115081 /DNA_START=112 /DNA_END=1707 /DNA_ORIENTATION=-
MSLSRSPSTASELNDFTEEDGKKVYNVSKSRLLGLVDWVTVIMRYLPILWYILMAVLVSQVGSSLWGYRFDLQAFYSREMEIIELQRQDALGLGWKTVLLIMTLLYYYSRREKPVYLVDFATFQPPQEWMVTPEQLMDIMRFQNCFDDKSLSFLERMLKHSGCGPATAWPPAITQCLSGVKATRSAEAARMESETVMFDCVRKVLAQTKVNPKEIDILVVNCSLFSPTPSLCSMVVNEFGFRSDCSTYNLAGMGCSAGLIAVELVKNMLAAKPNSTAMIVSTENLTQNLYHGNERSFLLQNTLFRCGGAAMILSNKWTDAFRARFKLLHVVRTQYVSEDSFGCVYETEDEHGQRGVRLSKEIVKVAGRALEKNFTSLGPLVLPLSEQLKTGFWMLLRYLSKQIGSRTKITPYVPDFKRGVDHFCIHAGGRGVIDGIEKNLNLTPRHVEASRYALYKYGNTSSSSIWYEMDYTRRSGDLRRGQRVLQVAFGSGFKCNSAVWLCMNNPEHGEERWAGPPHEEEEEVVEAKKTK